MSIYHAPVVRYPTGRSTRLALVVLGGLVLGAVTAGVSAYLTHGESGVMSWQNGLIAAAWLLAALCAWQFLQQLPAGWLDWNGAAWHWAAAAQPGDQPLGLTEQVDQEGVVSVRFDGQRWMLLRLEAPAGQGRWLWLEQRRSPERWHGVRCAVYSRAKAPVPSAASE